jgi:hypothetical protein
MNIIVRCSYDHVVLHICLLFFFVLFTTYMVIVLLVFR